MRCSGYVLADAEHQVGICAGQRATARFLRVRVSTDGDGAVAAMPVGVTLDVSILLILPCRALPVPCTPKQFVASACYILSTCFPK
jgi:hypothetical protein